MPSLIESRFSIFIQYNSENFCNAYTLITGVNVIKHNYSIFYTYDVGEVVRRNFVASYVRILLQLSIAIILILVTGLIANVTAVRLNRE